MKLLEALRLGKNKCPECGCKTDDECLELFGVCFDCAHKNGDC